MTQPTVAQIAETLDALRFAAHHRWTWKDADTFAYVLAHLLRAADEAIDVLSPLVQATCPSCEDEPCIDHVRL
mgnify:CR=1 FL=1